MKWVRFFFSGDNNIVDFKAVTAAFCLAMAVGVWLCYVAMDLQLVLQQPAVMHQGKEVKEVLNRVDLPVNIYNVVWAFIVAGLFNGVATLLNNNKLVTPLPPALEKPPEQPGKIGPVG